MRYRQTPQYRRSWDWQKSGGIPKTAVLGVIYITYKTLIWDLEMGGTIIGTLDWENLIERTLTRHMVNTSIQCYHYMVNTYRVTITPTTWWSIPQKHCTDERWVECWSISDLFLRFTFMSNSAVPYERPGFKQFSGPTDTKKNHLGIEVSLYWYHFLIVRYFNSFWSQTNN